MITLQYFNGTSWVEAGKFPSVQAAWLSLGSDCANYRTIDADGNILLTALPQ